MLHGHLISSCQQCTRPVDLTTILDRIRDYLRHQQGCASAFSLQLYIPYGLLHLTLEEMSVTVWNAPRKPWFISEHFIRIGGLAPRSSPLPLSLVA